MWFASSISTRTDWPTASPPPSRSRCLRRGRAPADNRRPCPVAASPRPRRSSAAIGCSSPRCRGLVVQRALSATDGDSGRGRGYPILRRGRNRSGTVGFPVKEVEHAPGEEDPVGLAGSCAPPVRREGARAGGDAVVFGSATLPVLKRRRESHRLSHPEPQRQLLPAAQIPPRRPPSHRRRRGAAPPRSTTQPATTRSTPRS